jgi:hypothetical protein
MTTTEIFPEDKIDPTAGAKEEQYPVERTLGVMGHVRVIAKKRKWQFLHESQMPEGSSTPNGSSGAVTFIRKFYSQPETAAVTHKDGVWAVWSDEGEPTTEAFPEYTPVDEGPGSEFLKSLQARLGQKPSEPTKEGSVAALPAAPYRDLAAEGEATARTAAFKRVESDEAYETASKAGQEAWAFSSIKINDHAAMRRRYGTSNDAVIEMHPTGRLAAIWLGKSTPTRPAFPDVQPVAAAAVSYQPVPEYTRHEQKNGNNGGPTPPAFPAPIGSTDEQLPLPVKVSGHAPSAALNQMGVKLYGLSKEGIYSPQFREWLQRVSDGLHAEAARIELGLMRAKLDARDRPPHTKES